MIKCRKKYWNIISRSLALFLNFFIININTACSKELSKVTLVLFDISESTNDESVRKGYLNDFKLILNKINPGDVIVVDKICEESIAKSNIPVKEEFDKLSFWNGGPLKE